MAGPAAGALVALAPLPARAGEIALPVENGHRADSPLPSAALATALCSTCHSAEYVLDPPPISPRTSWQATGTKRQKTFAAPLPDDAVAPIVGTRPKSPLAHFALDRVIVALIAPTACSLKSNRGNPTAK